MTLCFPGGGTYFWWQVGAALKLQELYSLESVVLCGASAGALAAVFARCEVSPAAAHGVAHELALGAGVFEKPLGLLGKWGRLVHIWLDRLLPPDAAERCSGTVAVKVTVFTPWPRLASLSHFASREELISALMASTHIPWFMDGYFMHRAKACPRAVDGAILVFLGLISEHRSLAEPQGRSLFIRQLDDEHFMSACAKNGWGPFLVDGTEDFVRFGAAWTAKQAAVGEGGHFASLEPHRRSRARQSTDVLLSAALPHNVPTCPLEKSGGTTVRVAARQGALIVAREHLTGRTLLSACVALVNLGGILVALALLIELIMNR